MQTVGANQPTLHQSITADNVMEGVDAAMTTLSLPRLVRVRRVVFVGRRKGRVNAV